MVSLGISDNLSKNVEHILFSLMHSVVMESSKGIKSKVGVFFTYDLYMNVEFKTRELLGYNKV